MTEHSQKRSNGPIRVVVWLLLVCIILMMITVPTSVGVQALLSVIGVAIILVLKPFVDTKFARLLLLSVASIIVLRYWFWRLFETLPGTDEPLSFAAAILLFSVETYAIGVFFLGAFLMADPIDRGRPKQMRYSDLPTVDILIPTLNEPNEMLAYTIAAAQNIDYPDHLKTVVLCDDGGTDQRCNHDDPAIANQARERRKQLQDLCESLGAVYMTRPANMMAKAGNLNEAMQRLSGEYVVVLDADHAPTPDFLARTIGFMVEDPKLALVQTPHFFLNADPVARNLNLVEHCPPENEMFYNAIQKGLDRWDGTFFCGSAAVLRRAALDEVGGISGDTITEDAETSLKIQALGWRSLYVNHAMIAGLQPETFASFIKQRGRWATGMVQLLILKNPLFLRGLNFWQRVCYFNSVSYWLFPIVRIVLLLAPLAYLFFGLELLVTTASEAAVYMSGYMIAAYLTQNSLFHSTRWPFVSEIYEIAQSPYLIRGVIGAFLRPRGASFNVTSKDEIVDADRYSEAALPLIILFVLMLAGLAAAGWRYMSFPGDREVIMIVGAWTVFNAVLVGAAAAAVVDRTQRRAAPRVDVSHAIRVARAGEDVPREINGTLVDLSRTGGKLKILRHGDLEARGMPAIGTELDLVPANSSQNDTEFSVRATVVRAGNDGGYGAIGISFAPTQSNAAYRAMSELLNGNSYAWEAMRSKQLGRKSLFTGSLYAFSLFVTGLLRLLGPAFKKRAGGAKADVPRVDELDAWTLPEAPSASAHAPDGPAPAFAFGGSPKPSEERTFGVSNFPQHT